MYKYNPLLVSPRQELAPFQEQLIALSEGQVPILGVETRVLKYALGYFHRC